MGSLQPLPAVLLFLSCIKALVHINHLSFFGDASLGRCVPCTLRPKDYSSLTDVFRLITTKRKYIKSINLTTDE
jgi:hypothetical protein